MMDPTASRTILVTDGDERATLAVVRSLGRAGHRVHVLAPRVPCLAAGSRFCAAEHRSPGALGDPRGFGERLRELSRELEADVILPITDASVLAVLERPGQFGGARVPFVDLETFRRASDKEGITRIAEEIGLGVPRSVTLDRADDLSEVDPDRLAYPLVVKPARSVFVSAGGRQKAGVSYASDRTALRRRLESLPEGAFPVLLQQRIRGTGTGVFLLLWDGRVQARFAHRRLREKPPSGGVSVYRESVACDETLFERSAELLRRVGWRGVAMIEYKTDEASGTPYLMEVNGRFWGSLQLAVDAGVDFPRLLVESSLGHPSEPVLSYRSGVRTRWTLGDLDHLLTRMRRSRADLDLGPDAPGRGRTVAAFLAAFLPPTRSEVFRWSDPGPFLRELRGWVREALE